ncbi:MAG TPA: sigma 54-interacting transcriptional regulator [Kofleriaceae bacterium]
MAAGGTETRSFDHASLSDEPASYLLAIDNLSSRRIDLPEDGILQIGRSEEADIKIRSEAVSRLHAKLILSGGHAQIADLGSHNGTLVNGERLDGSCALSSGDVVTIAETLLILRSARSERTGEPLDLDHMTRRVDQEIARATDYDRPFSLVVVRFDGESRSHGVGATALAALRPMDVVCVHGNSLIALLPELDAHAGHAQGVALIEALGGSAVRGGIASYPADGCDTATLLAAARGSLSIARPGQLVIAASAAVEYRIGANRVLVADAAMLKLYDLIRRLARSDISVLVTGETGSGKENAAAAVHHWSPRAVGPLVALNCAALPESLAESELFGYERGAFSDAKTAKPGLLERASGGTLFLDEVGDLSLTLQAKLLRALELKCITRLGDVREREIDVRIVSATNVDLEAAVGQGRFRQDLLFRLTAATVAIPPLRHRRQEIPLLARTFVQLQAERLGRGPLDISEAALAVLARHGYPGHVRELKNAMDFAVATAEGSAIQPHDLPERMTASDATSAATAAKRPSFRPLAEALRELERHRMIEALDACDGIQTRAATLLGMPLRTFTHRMRQYGIESRDRKR